MGRIFFQPFRRGTSMPAPQGGAHFWKIPESPGHADSLSESERKYWQSLANPESALRYVSAQGGLRAILAGYLGVSPSGVVLERGPHGKPFVRGAPEFNMSHSAGTICAVFSDAAVGLDVEARGRRVRGMALADKFFGAAECRHLHSRSGDEQRVLFLRYWVCKEAIVKLSGEGIYHGLRDTDVTLEDDGAPRGSYRGRPVWLWEFSPAAGMLGALAAWEPCEVKGFFEIL